MECTNLRESMMGALYGEATDDERRAVDRHLSGCPSCREEMASLRRLRRKMKAWSVPEGEARPRAGRGWLRPVAAAAVLALSALGAWRLSGFEARYEGGGWTFRFGPPSRAEILTLVREEEGRLEQRLRDRQDEALRAALALTSAPSGGEATLQRVREMIEESNVRQAEFLRTNLRDLEQRTEAQRRYDLARVSAGLSYLDGRTGRDVARTTELVNYVLQSQKR